MKNQALPLRELQLILTQESSLLHVYFPTLILIIYLGSSDLFLPGKDCTENCEGHKVYDTGASSTSQDLGRRFTLGFGDGSSVQGEQFSDTVTIAGLTVCSFPKT